MDQEFPISQPTAIKLYLDELELYDKVMNCTALISFNQHDIQTDGRGLRAMKIFTRQTLLGVSLKRLLPQQGAGTPIDADFWDICSIASISRNLLEGYLSLYYFGIEKITEEEADLRFQVLQLHSNVESFNIRNFEDSDAEEYRKFSETITEQRNRIISHPFISSLSKEEKDRVRRGNEMYKTKADFETELEICKDLRKNFRYLSNWVHPVPLFIERMDNLRGRGLGSAPDVSHTTFCLMIARKYLAGSTVGIADHFPDILANRFSKQLAVIRPLIHKGFS